MFQKGAEKGLIQKLNDIATQNVSLFKALKLICESEFNVFKKISKNLF